MAHAIAARLYPWPRSERAAASGWLFNFLTSLVSLAMAIVIVLAFALVLTDLVSTSVTVGILGWEERGPTARLVMNYLGLPGVWAYGLIWPVTYPALYLLVVLLTGEEVAALARILLRRWRRSVPNVLGSWLRLGARAGALGWILYDLNPPIYLWLAPQIKETIQFLLSLLA